MHLNILVSLMEKSPPHLFHIPVMGLGFTIDTPLKVARYGISSVISIIEHHLIEQMREVVCKKEQIPYLKIHDREEDCKAKRITAYLNLLQQLVDKQTEKIRNENFAEDRDINKYFEMLPEDSVLKKLYSSLPYLKSTECETAKTTLKQSIVAGAIDVNIMTKTDKTNYGVNGQELPVEFSEALAALRGFAKSSLSSSVVFSAGLNPRLFSYCEKFDDFFPDAAGRIKKKIILKVSDFRSALVQGKYLAKKGLWVSEFRIELGINCGGHTFITNGVLLGPILEEFKNKRSELTVELYNECELGLNRAGRTGFGTMPTLKITAQGGIGTHIENNFLANYFRLDSTGWGSPFLLVPEATNVDSDTLQKLADAKKEDYYLSHSSPLGIPFNNFRKSSSENQRKQRISKNRPGSPCYKKLLVSNTEFTVKPICTASREYQKLKIDELTKTTSDETKLKTQISLVVEKDCLCEGLGASALHTNNAKLSHNLGAVAICPGPNLAYFSRVFSLKEMVDHIYGRVDILNRLNRPNLFVNELQLYVDYLKKELEGNLEQLSAKRAAHFVTFKSNLLEGIVYYENLFTRIKESNALFQKSSMQILESIKQNLSQILIPVVQ